MVSGHVGGRGSLWTRCTGGFVRQVLPVLRRGRPMLTIIVAYVSLAFVFIADAMTPASLMVEVAYEVPVAFAAWTGIRGLTIRLMILALASNTVSALMDAFDPVTLTWHATSMESRLVAYIAVVICGTLALVVQVQSVALGRVLQQDADGVRERILTSASDRFFTLLAPFHVGKAISEEGLRFFSGSVSVWLPSDELGSPWISTSLDSGEMLDDLRADELRMIEGALPDLSEGLVVGSDGSLREMFMVSRTSGVFLRLAIVHGSDRFGSVFVFLPGVLKVEEATLVSARAFSRLASSVLHQTVLVNELERRNTGLHDRQELITELVEAISHDVRTPLVALSTTMKQAHAGAFGVLPAEYVAVLQESLTSIDDIRNLAETLLLVARFESEPAPGPLESVDLFRLGRELTAEFAAVARTRGVVFRCSIPSDVCVVGVRSHIRRALVNLLSNAFGHTPAGGNVALAVSVGDRRAEVTIDDDGFGVAPEAVSSLFSRFANRTSRGGGTGLGLYIVRRVAEEAGGSVAYAARASGGSRFTLSLPLARVVVPQ